MNDKPKNGAMRINAGKMSMYLNGAWVDFGVLYVAKDMKRIAKPVNGRRSAYSVIIRGWAGMLEREGMAALRVVQWRLRSFYGCSEKWMAQDCRIWHGWLQQIWQFRNCAGKKDVPVKADANRNFRDNYDKTFQKAT